MYMVTHRCQLELTLASVPTKMVVTKARNGMEDSIQLISSPFLLTLIPCPALDSKIFHVGYLVLVRAPVDYLA